MFETIDIHGMKALEARQYIEKVIREAPHGAQITVIHGYRSGQKLQTMVRHLKHERIRQRIVGLNDGQTILLLT